MIGSYFLSFDYLVIFFSYKVKRMMVCQKLVIIYHWSWLKRQRVPNGRKRLFLDDFDHLLMMRVWKIDERGSSENGDLFCFSLYHPCCRHYYNENILRKIHFPNPFSHEAFQTLTPPVTFLFLLFDKWFAFFTFNPCGIKFKVPWVNNEQFFPIGEFPTI